MSVYRITDSLRRRTSKVGPIGVALAAAVTLASCGSGSSTATTQASTGSSAGTAGSVPGLYGTLPPVGLPAKSGGVITFGQLSGTNPNYIFPIVPAANSSVYNLYEFENYLFVPLYWGTVGTIPEINPTVSLANMPTYSNGGKTVTFSIKPGYSWSNGAPVDANDVIFFIDELKAAVKESPANFGNYTPGFFPDNVVSATATGKYTVTLQLTRSYNTSFFTDNELGLITPMPSTAWNIASANGPHLDYSVPANATAIYNYLSQQANDLSTYATNPLWQVVDGPMRLTSFTPSTGAFTMVPNPHFGGHKVQFSELQGVTFTSVQAEFNQLIAGNLTVGGVDFSVLPQVSRIESKYNVYGLPDFGFQAAFYNFKDTTGNWSSEISQLYLRQALAHLEDQTAYIKGLYKGAAVPDYGPIGVSPPSPYTPANAKNNPYPYSISAAANLLKSHGWKVVPNGTTECVKPGTASGDCGAGIPLHATISPTMFYTNSPPILGEQAQAFAAAAKQVGINIQLNAKTFNFLVSNYSVAGAPANNNKWAINDFGGFSAADYPTTNNIFNTGGSFNFGGYSDATANKLISNSVYGSNPNAVSQEASYLTEQQPALFTPASDFIYAVSKSLSGTNENSFSALTQFQPLPQYWYFTK